MLKTLGKLIGGSKTSEEKILETLKSINGSVRFIGGWLPRITTWQFKQSMNLIPMEFGIKAINNKLDISKFADTLANKMLTAQPESKGVEKTAVAEAPNAEDKKEAAVHQAETTELLKEQNNFIHGIEKSLTTIDKNLDKLVKYALSKAGKGLFSGGGGGAGKGAGGAIGGFLKGVGEGLSALGKGIAGLGAGIGKALEGILSGLARGLRALSDPKLLIGVGVMLGLAGALWIAAKGFQAFADVSWEAVIKGTVALGILTVAAIALGTVMESGVGAVAIFLGAAAIAALGASLLPAAFAANLAAPLFEKMALVIEKLGDAIVNIIAAGFNGVIALFDKLSQVDVVKIALIGPALAAMAVGLAALTGGSLLSSFGDFVGSMFGAKSPIQKLQELAATAPGVQLLAVSLEAVAKNISTFTESMKDLDVDKLDHLRGSLIFLLDTLMKINSGNTFETLQSMFGVKSPIDNIKELSKTAEPMKMLADSVGILNEKLAELLNSLAEVDVENINQLGPALKGVGDGFDAMVKVTVQSDLAEKFLGIDSPFTKIEKLASQGPSMQQLADAISQIDLSGLSLDDKDIQNLDAVIVKLNELNFAMAGMQFAKLTNAASSLLGNISDSIGQDISKTFGLQIQSPEQKSQTATNTANVIPVKITEIASDSEMTTKITSLLKEKTIEEKIGTSASQSIISAPTVNNVSSTGGTTINSTSVKESPTNNEPLLLSAVKGDLSAV